MSLAMNIAEVLFVLLGLSTFPASTAHWAEHQECASAGPLGMITGEIEDWQISASSTYPNNWDKGCHEKYARVYQKNKVAWCSKYKSSSEWLHIDLGVPAKITGVMTQGRGDGSEWVTSFMVSYSIDAYQWTYVTDQYGNQRVFEGNTDSYSVKHTYLDAPVAARFIKFHTIHWHNHPSLRVEILGCQACKRLLAMPPYIKMTASSEKSFKKGGSCRANDGLLVTGKGWCAKTNDGSQWLQFDVGPPTMITGLVTKGRGDTRRKHWVTRFRLAYSNDTKVWHFYKDARHLSPKEFGANVDKNLERYHFLNVPFVARYVRFHPVHWHEHISMRAGLLGCPYQGDCGPGFISVTQGTQCVENMAFKKESWINSRRHNKRHTRNRWMHGHAARAVDGKFDQSLYSCTILDNFYVEKPVWMVDLGEKKLVAGIVIITWQGSGPKAVKPPDSKMTHQDYTHNLDKLVVYVDNKGGKEPADLSTQMCGFVSRLNDAVFKPRLHVQCLRPMKGRYVYIEAWGVANRWSRLFNAVLCEVLVY